MDQERFDQLTRTLASGVSRRGVVRAGGGGLLALLFAGFHPRNGAAGRPSCPSGVTCKGQCCPLGTICVKGKGGGCACPPNEVAVSGYCCPPTLNNPVQCNSPYGSNQATSAVCCPPGTTDCYCDSDAGGTVTCTCCDCSAGGTCSAIYDPVNGTRTTTCVGCTCSSGEFKA